jgi:hypothetical protein
MNYNILSYSIYLPVTFYLTFVVGKICFTNGEIYLHRIMNDHPDNVKSINRLLLIAYYLFNLGYAAIMLSHWPVIDNISQSILIAFNKIGLILFILGILHYNNMLMTYYLSKIIHKQKSLTKSQSL